MLTVRPNMLNTQASAGSGLLAVPAPLLAFSAVSRRTAEQAHGLTQQKAGLHHGMSAQLP